MFHIDCNSKTPLYEQIYIQIRSSILNKEISAGSKLPSIRELAEQLHVSRNTVENAYNQLLVEGYVRGIRGSGYKVQVIKDYFFADKSDISGMRDEDIVEKTAPLYNFNYSLALAKFMEKGYWERHLRKIKKVCGARREILIKNIENNFKNQAEIISSNAGIHILVDFRLGLSEKETAEKSAANGVALYPVKKYYMQKDKAPYSTILMGFGSINDDDTEKGVSFLKTCILIKE